MLILSLSRPSSRESLLFKGKPAIDGSDLPDRFFLPVHHDTSITNRDTIV